MKKCTTCKKKRDIVHFNFKNKGLGLRHSQCKDCTRSKIRGHYSKNKEYYLNKTQIRNRFLRLEVNTYIRDYLLENPCIDCGESDITVLEFDHHGRAPKLMAISSLVRAQYSLKKIKEEINKCEVRCANCHRKKTAKDFKWFKDKKALVA